jgi:anhydro-N-acetylmuramic acid kinase
MPIEGVRPAAATHCIGLMSGTSLDGIDAVLMRWDSKQTPPHTLAHLHTDLPQALRDELLALNRPGMDELHRAWLAGHALALAYADATQALLKQTGLHAGDILAIGAHGQTVRHQPQGRSASPANPDRLAAGYTIQLNQPAVLAERTGIDVVADFRSRDIAAGGQGAPLVPAFHREIFGRAGHSLGVLNIGGIANLTVLGPSNATSGFDCGPGNALLDHWCQRHTGTPYDDGGQWAAGGQVDAALLARLLAEPFLDLDPPKSTGRDLFNPDWLAQRLDAADSRSPVDVQATLTAFTARACADAVRRHGQGLERLIVCGGGVFNHHLMARLAGDLPGMLVEPSDLHGLPALQVEAAAFAWLAYRTIRREPGSLASVTGARGARVLGAIYPR